MRTATRVGELWACVLLALGTLIAFCQVVRFDFVNYDDPVYVSNNSDVQNGLNLDTVLWAFGETHKSAHWHPLTWLSLALDWDLYGENAGGFHLTNLLLHLANTLLLFWVLRLSTGAVWRSAAVAGLFGWHPLHVESVAWITERKDVLSTLFWMLTMLFYVMYVQKSASVAAAGGFRHPLFARKVWGLYALTILFFALGLLSKPMLVPLPCVLLLWDNWPLRRTGQGHRWRWLVLEKVPFFLLALISGLWTSRVMAEGTLRRTGEVLTLGGRVQNALLAAVTLLRKMVWPSDLGVYYPVKLDPTYDPTIEAVLAGCFLAFVSLLAYLARHKHSYLLVGWLWYLGTLVLVVLRLQAGSFTWADRYTYVPLIGIFIAAVWGVCDWFERFPRTLCAGFLAVLLACLALTWQQVKIWQNSETLWRHTLAVTEENTNFLAHYDLALYLQEQHRLPEALEHFQAAVNILPHIAEFRLRLIRTHMELARSLQRENPSAARQHLVQARQNLNWLLERDPHDKPAFRENLTRTAAEINRLLK